MVCRCPVPLQNASTCCPNCALHKSSFFLGVIHFLFSFSTVQAPSFWNLRATLLSRGKATCRGWVLGMGLEGVTRQGKGTSIKKRTEKVRNTTSISQRQVEQCRHEKVRLDKFIALVPACRCLRQKQEGFRRKSLNTATEMIHGVTVFCAI